jgi:hypothetical protein
MDGEAWKRREASVIPSLLPTALVQQEGAVFALVCTDQPTHGCSAYAGMAALAVGVGAGDPSTLSALALAIERAHSRPFGRF